MKKEENVVWLETGSKLIFTATEKKKEEAGMIAGGGGGGSSEKKKYDPESEQGEDDEEESTGWSSLERQAEKGRKSHRGSGKKFSFCPILFYTLADDTNH